VGARGIRIGEIKQAWEASRRPIQDLGDIASNLHKVMISLKRWCREKFGAVTKEIAKIRKDRSLVYRTQQVIRLN
jgi:hypothetical protein